MLLHFISVDITKKRVGVLGFMLDWLNIWSLLFFCHCAKVIIHKGSLDVFHLCSVDWID